MSKHPLNVSLVQQLTNKFPNNNFEIVTIGENKEMKITINYDRTFTLKLSDLQTLHQMSLYHYVDFQHEIVEAIAENIKAFVE
jgi:hypothetical protein